MIKTVLLDLDDTILDFHKAEGIALRKALTEMDVPVSDEIAERYSEINAAQWRALERGEIAQSELRLRRFMRFYDLYPVPGDPKAASDRFATLLGEQSILMPHAEQVVRAIAAHLPVVIVTNGMTAIQKNRLARSPSKT